MSGPAIGLGYSWYYDSGPYVTMNLYDQSTVNINDLFWGGHLNLYGGIFNVAGTVIDSSSNEVTDARRLLNLAGGQLVLVGDATATVNDWIARGILAGYGVVGAITTDTTSDPGHTIVTGVVPEPSCLALLGLGTVLRWTRTRQGRQRWTRRCKSASGRWPGPVRDGYAVAPTTLRPALR
jgi:hypothetical protein